MDAKEIFSMCKRLARRYKNPTHYEDLVSEGIVMCYEVLAKEPDAPVFKLYRKANSAMHDYLNLSVLPVTVPKSDVSRRLARNKDVDLSDIDTNWTDDGIELLRMTLKSEVVDAEKSNIVQPSSEEIYENINFIKVLYRTLSKELSGDEQLMFYMRFDEDMTLAECGQFFGISKEAAYYRESKIVNKVRDIVVKLQQVENL